jgi:hypothetical protein
MIDVLINTPEYGVKSIPKIKDNIDVGRITTRKPNDGPSFLAFYAQANVIKTYFDYWPINLVYE